MLAARRILPARVPSSGQRRVEELEPAKQQAIERSAGVLRQHMLNENRKGSVTTQDFFDEATRIMDFIRAEGRPASAPASPTAVEGEAKHHDEGDYDDDQYSEPESFTRPPSREGSSELRPTRTQQPDPRVVSHLRKYAETADNNGLISSSMRLSGELHRAEASQAAEVMSDPPNMRITGSKDARPAAVPDEASLGGQVNSKGSNASSGKASSGRSDNRQVISLERVQHLIPEQVAGMKYDSVRQTWVRRVDAGAESDEDPLGNIPDLSVDEMAEVMGLQQASPRRAGGGAGIVSGGSAQRAPNIDVRVERGAPGVDPRPTTREGAPQPVAESSSMPSKFSMLASSGPPVETRATSWGDEQVYAASGRYSKQREVKTQTTQRTRLQPVTQETEPQTEKQTKTRVTEVQQTREEDVEHEILAHEGRGAPTNATPAARRVRRDMTITFSSPVVSRVIETSATDAADVDWADNALALESSFISPRVAKPTLQQQGQRRHAERRVSIGGRTFKVRQVPSIREHDEDDGDQSVATVKVQKATFDVTVSAPGVHGSTCITPARAVASNISLHLSPLPEFTFNVGNETALREAHYLTVGVGNAPPAAVETPVPQVTSHLVRVLTDVEPFEPYWDQMRRIEMRKRGLTTLHQLGEYCGRLEEVDVSDNEIDHLGGAPAGIRHLRIANNSLTSLTAWGHLSNLQTLDVSGNGAGEPRGGQVPGAPARAQRRRQPADVAGGRVRDGRAGAGQRATQPAPRGGL